MAVMEQLLLKPPSPIDWRSWVSVERINDMRHAIGGRALDEEVGHVRRDAPVNQLFSAAQPPRFCVTFCVPTRYG